MEQNMPPRYRTMDLWKYRKKWDKRGVILLAIVLGGCLIFMLLGFLIDNVDVFMNLAIVYCLFAIVAFIIYLYNMFKLVKILDKNQIPGRFSASIYTKFNDSTQLYNEVCNYMKKIDYTLVNYDGETVFEGRYNPLVSYPRYIKISIVNNIIIAECWLVINEKEYALGDYKKADMLTHDMDGLSNYFDF